MSSRHKAFKKRARTAGMNIGNFSKLKLDLTEFVRNVMFKSHKL